jgi:transcriptional regulator with XRE-family HTH domain
MNGKLNIGKIIKDQRKKVSLSLNQLAKLSGVSVSHLGRIEQGHRQPSTRTLQKIAKHLGFDLYELLVIAGHLLPDPSTFSEEQRDKLRVELNVLLERVAADSTRIKEIVNRLILSK